MFYNLRTKTIEDWTGKGLDDLEKGILRTPTDPAITFSEDPLRVLRALRFAVSKRLDLDRDLIDAAHEQSIVDGLMKKVSRERVGIEMRKAWTRGDLKRMAMLWKELQLGPPVFIQFSNEKNLTHRVSHYWENLELYELDEPGDEGKRIRRVLMSSYLDLLPVFIGVQSSWAIAKPPQRWQPKLCIASYPSSLQTVLNRVHNSILEDLKVS